MHSREDHGWRCPDCGQFHQYVAKLECGAPKCRKYGFLPEFTRDSAERILKTECCWNNILLKDQLYDIGPSGTD